MNEDKIVVYETFIDPIKANIVKGLLESYDIECFLADENMVTLNAMYSQAIGGVKLNVFEKDIDRINALLKAENSNSESISDEKEEVGMICPNCNSHNVGYGGSVKKKFSVWTALFFSLLSMYPFYQKKAFHCFDCDHEFKKV